MTIAEITTIVAGALVAFGVPSALTAYLFRRIEKTLDKREKASEEREQARKKMELNILDGINACNKLSIATAKAVQRIPDAHCNGDMHEALTVAIAVQTRQDAFLREQVVETIRS